MYDIIVAGTGPSGALLAYSTASSGLRTLIIEKAQLPRYKVCGGGVPLKTIHSVPFDISPVLEVVAIGGKITFAGVPFLKVDFDKDFGGFVMRDRFDNYLVEKAVAAGAELNTGVSLKAIEQTPQLVTAITSQGTYTAKFLAGADGVNSIVAKSTGLLPNRETGTAIEAEVAVPGSDLQEQGPYVTFDFGALPQGYGWIFPKHDHLSVGVFKAQAGKVHDLQQRLEEYMNQNPVLKNRRVISQQGHRIPLGGKDNHLHKGRVLLVGDAANLADAWIGEGIYYALNSAKIAAEEIHLALQKDLPDLSSYSNRIENSILTQLRQARFFGKLVYWKPHAMSVLLSRSKHLQTHLFAAIRGDITLAQFNRNLIKELPLIAWEGITKRGPG